MIRIEQPDYEIKIGIKDGKVIRVDWRGYVEYEKTLELSDITGTIRKYLRLARKFIK